MNPTPISGNHGDTTHIKRDILLVLALTTIVIGIGAHAPSHSYAYAQMRQMGASLGMIEHDNWLLPHNHEERLMRKPQLYGWLTAPVLLATNTYTDFVYRWPSVAAGLACAVLVYLLGRRWYGRRVGLLATVLWATSLHMGKLMYLGTTDMLHTLWITMAIFCADRLLFHPAPKAQQPRWAIGLWSAIILGALTKGWGIGNIPLVGGWIVLAAVVSGPIWLIRLPDTRTRFQAAIIIMWRRFWRAMVTCRLGWGIAAFLAVMIPLSIAMFLIGGKDFWEVVEYEVIRRSVGGGEKAPHTSSAPPIAWLLCYTFPASFFAVGTLVTYSSEKWKKRLNHLRLPHVFWLATAAMVSLTWSLRKWFTRLSPLRLPLLWIIAIVLPFSLAHGFRPDYLLPCYAAVAMIAALGIERVTKLGKEHKLAGVLRHVFAAVTIVLGLTLSVGALLYLLHDHLPTKVAKAIHMPALPPADAITWSLAILGVIVTVAAIIASLRWKLFTVATLACVAMLGVLFIDRHMIARGAKTGDGEQLIAFAQQTKPFVGDENFAVCRAEKMGTELYWGRFGNRVTSREQLDELDAKWLITCDAGLVMLDAAPASDKGTYAYRHPEKGKLLLQPRPETLGEVIDWGTCRPIQADRMGQLYLIKLKED